MVKSILDRIPKDEVENIKLFRLGVFENSSYEFVELKKAEDYPGHHHKKSDAKFLFILGEGDIILDGKKHKYKKGDSFDIPRGMVHGFQPDTQTLFLSIQTPPIKNQKTGKEDIHFH